MEEVWYRIVYPSGAYTTARLHRPYCGVLVTSVLDAYVDWWLLHQGTTLPHALYLKRQQLYTIQMLSLGLALLSGAQVRAVVDAWGDLCQVSWHALLRHAEQLGWVTRVCYPEEDDIPSCKVCTDQVRR